MFQRVDEAKPSRMADHAACILRRKNPNDGAVGKRVQVVIAYTVRFCPNLTV